MKAGVGGGAEGAGSKDAKDHSPRVNDTARHHAQFNLKRREEDREKRDTSKDLAAYNAREKIS